MTAVKERHATAAYDAGFQAYMAASNEKAVLLAHLAQLFEQHHVRSVLDIGAGDGALALPLAAKVRDYDAFEQRKDYAERLRSAGVSVIQGAYPAGHWLVRNLYDAVLSLHSLPWHKPEYAPFLEAALSHRRPRTGRLYVITYDVRGAWSKLREACGLPMRDESYTRIKDLTDWLQDHGSLKVRHLETVLNTHTLEELRAALAFVYSDGDEARTRAFLENAQVTEYLRHHHYWGTYWAFSFTHVLFEVG